MEQDPKTTGVYQHHLEEGQGRGEKVNKEEGVFMASQGLSALRLLLV
jgi:hypothetical protein